MTDTIFRNVRIFDGASDKLMDGRQVRVSGGIVQAIEHDDVDGGAADVIDCGGRVLMPGLIDAHVHLYASGLNFAAMFGRPITYHAHHAATFLKNILNCGFTTVRDVGGADAGIAAALREGLLQGPRLFYGGHVISQTGGHGDFRHAETEADLDCCGCRFAHVDFIAVVAHGVDAVRAAVRDKLRRGASHIKLMGSGGVISPNDPIDRCQYSEAEISVAVEEAERWGSYVAVHCHPADGVKRLARLRVRSIEHGTLIDAEGADVVAKAGTYVVPTMATLFALLDNGRAMGLPRVSYDKLATLSDQALKGLEIMRSAGVKMGFGTDLLGPFYTLQGTEFSLRAQALPAIDILRSACSVNAELIRQKEKLGCIAPKAHADLLVVDGDPLADIGVLAKPDGAGLAAIMKAGVFIKRTL